jgi:hypothetical protein
MPAQKPKVSRTEKHFNNVVVIVAKVAALVLGVLALGGYTIQRLSSQSVIGLLTVAIVLLALAGIQDSTAIIREIREHDAQKRLNDTLIESIQNNVANIQINAQKLKENAEKIEATATQTGDPKPDA